MFQRIGLVLIGIALLYSGGMLTAEELQLAEVREIMHTHNLGRMTVGKAGAAFSALHRMSGQRGDLAAPMLDLALYLESETKPADGDQFRIDARHRVDASARTLARHSPLSAKAWCVLALSEAQERGATGTAVERLRACYRLAPRDGELIAGRLALVLAAWDQLPRDLQTLAMTEVAEHLREQRWRAAMIERLAFATATVAPERVSLVEPLVELHGKEAKDQFERSFQRFRQQSLTRSARS